MKQWFAVWCMCVVCLSCERQAKHHGLSPLVEVAGKYLYREDLRKAMPMSLSPDDSILFAERYIRNWVEETLMQDNAMRNVQVDDNIERLVENYRRSLVLHNYQQRLITQRLSKEVSDEAVDSFYQANAQQFLLERPLAKGLYIKVPLKSKGLGNVRQWYKDKNQSSIEKLEKYSLQNAVDYLYFYDRWMQLDEILEKLPLNVSRPQDYVRQQRDVEISDTAFIYFLHIEEMLKQGEQMPLDYADPEIREILSNMKQVSFMKQVRNELYDEAVRKKRVTYYY